LWLETPIVLICPLCATEKINYKLKKSTEKPREEWVKVENTHEAILSEDTFRIVQNLLETDGRVSPVTEENSLFTGILFCGDCGEQMVRRINRYKGMQRVYFICSTKNRGEGCSRHSIEEGKLTAAVEEAVKNYANLFLSEKKLFEKSLELEANFESIVRFDQEIARLKQEQDRYYSLCSGLYEDLKNGVVTKEEFERLHGGFQRKAEEFREAQEKQEAMIKGLFRNGVLSAGRLKTMQDCAELKEMDRCTLCSMVRRILVFEGGRIEIEFYFMPHYRIMCGVNQGMQELVGRAERGA
ncbi:MAG: recombinase family protein, partial [Acetatifactor muris]|nr:recombinase family protein [Acetatifactor muris]